MSLKAIESLFSAQKTTYVIQAVPKKCPGHIWYVNDNLIYAHLYRLPHVGFATLFFIDFKFTWGKRYKCV